MYDIWLSFFRYTSKSIRTIILLEAIKVVCKSFWLFYIFKVAFMTGRETHCLEAWFACSLFIGNLWMIINLMSINTVGPRFLKHLCICGVVWSLLSSCQDIYGLDILISWWQVTGIFSFRITKSFEGISKECKI